MRVNSAILNRATQLAGKMQNSSVVPVRVAFIPMQDWNYNSQYIPLPVVLPLPHHHRVFDDSGIQKNLGCSEKLHIETCVIVGGLLHVGDPTLSA